MCTHPQSVSFEELQFSSSPTALFARTPLIVIRTLLHISPEVHLELFLAVMALLLEDDFLAILDILDDLKTLVGDDFLVLLLDLLLS